MRLRDILILLGLIALILGLTVAEKYAQRTREDRKEQEITQSLAMRQEAVLKSFRERWSDLSDSLRFTLDSMAAEIVRGGVPEESLAVMVVESPPETVYVEVDGNAAAVEASDSDLMPAEDEAEAPVAADEPKENVQAEEDDLAKRVASEYHDALRALPRDLNAYEQRVATNEIASLIRTRYNLATERFDLLLKRAATLSKGG